MLEHLAERRRTTVSDVLTRERQVMRFVTLEDEGGFVEVTLFPGTCPPGTHLALGPYLASGVVEDQFGVGDTINTGEATGVVESVSLRTTRIRDEEGVVWHIPNGEIKRIANRSQPSS